MSPGSPAHELVGVPRETAEIASSPSVARGADRVGERTYVALIATMVALLVIRQAAVWIAPAFLQEEAVGWWSATFVHRAAETVIMPWNGFVYPGIRAAFLLARLVPVEAAPLVTLTLFTLSIALIGAFMASDRMATALPDRRLRLGAAVALAALPFATASLYATVIDVGWFAAVYLAAVLVATPAPNRAWRWADRIGVLLAVSVTPAILFLAPLYVWQHRDRIVVAIVVVASVVQVLTFATAPRVQGGLAGLLDGLPADVLRIGALPFGDRLGAILLASVPLAIVTGVLIAFLVVQSARTLPPRTLLVFGWVAVVLIVTSGSNATPGRELDPTDATRYYVAAAWLLAVIAIAGYLSGRRAGAALLVVFGLALAVSFGVEDWAGTDWRCIGSDQPCTIGTLKWTGDPADFRVPAGLGPPGWLYAD